MPIKIVTDSTSDLPEALTAELGITVVPAYVTVGEQSFRDGVDMSREEFYARLPGFATPPVTAAPSPDQFRQAYEALAAQGATEIISIHLSGTLSSLFASAQRGADETQAARVTAFDARQASMGIGFPALAAAQAAAAGQSLADILTLLKNMVTRTHLFAALDTLEYLRRGGRLSSVEAGLGSLLQIKPILKLYDGQLTSERVRTRSQSITRMVALLRELGPLEQLAVLHTQARERAEELRHQIQELWPQGQPPIVLVATPALGTHVGPGALGFVAVRCS